MSGLHVNRSVLIADAELRESFSRSTGPGGQNVNKVSTKVELRWTPATSIAFSEHNHAYLLRRLAARLTGDGELVVTCDEHRTQIRNRETARMKMAQIIRQALERPKKRRPTKPTRASVQRRISAKKRRSQTKQGRRRASRDEG